MNSLEKELFKLLFINEFFSTCCDAPANVGGDDSGKVRFYYCSNCGEHCQTLIKKNENNEQELYAISKTEEDNATASS